MSRESTQELKERIKSASPLDLYNVLQEAELDDAKDAHEVIDEVYSQFKSGESLKDQVLIPVFTSIIDGCLESTSATRKLRKKGLTSTRLLNECQHFTYGDGSDVKGPTLDAYSEDKNAREYTTDYGEKERTKYDRGIYDNNAKSSYKAEAVAANNGRVNLVDEYTGERNISAYKSEADARRNDPKHRYQAQPDHIVPLAKVHEQLKGNYALSDGDIAKIANNYDNLANTAAYINQGVKGRGGKNDMTNSEFIADQQRRARNGEEHLGLSGETMETMLRKEQEAQHTIDSAVNKTVKDNLLGKGDIDKSILNKALESEGGKLGRKLTKDEVDGIKSNLIKEKQQDIADKVAGNALNQSKDYAVGNVILYLIKPLYYEISDIFENGLKDGVGAESVFEAFSIRFGRVKDYVIKNMMAFIGDNIKDFILGFISSIVEGVISLFVGVFKQILKLLKEGIRIFTQSGKILFGKESANMSSAEKGDAIIKLIGGSVIAMCGIGIEALLNKIGIMEPWSVVLSTMLSGIASALFMFLLDKMDLFSVKDEKRAARIDEIFKERINDLREAKKAFDNDAMEKMRQQRIVFDNLRDGLNSKDINVVNSSLYKLANFFNINLSYKNTEQFCDYMESNSVILL